MYDWTTVEWWFRGGVTAAMVSFGLSQFVMAINALAAVSQAALEYPDAPSNGADFVSVMQLITGFGLIAAGIAFILIPKSKRPPLEREGESMKQIDAPGG